jgi:hypothetical protein
MRSRPIDPLPAADVAAYAMAQVAFAAAAWPLRAAEELRSAMIYRALAAASRSVLPAFTERFAVVAREEVGHARLCATVGARLRAPAPTYDVEPVRQRLAALADLRERVIALVVAEVAIGETISMAMFREGRRATTEPLSRAAIEHIVADEARHQQLGWDALAALAGDPHTASHTVHALAAAEQQIAVPALRFLEAKRTFDPAWAALGVIEPSRRVDAFYAAVEQLVLPRLERLGIPGRQLWAARYRRGASSGITSCAPAGPE